MRKSLITLGIIITLNSAPIDSLNMDMAHAQQEVPAYVKWGKLAVKEVHLKYPNANIIDYLHEGRETKGSSTTEKFKLWLKEGDKEFGVYVRIEYITETEKVVKIEFIETLN